MPPVELCPPRVNDPLLMSDAGANLQYAGIIGNNVAARFSTAGFRVVFSSCNLSFALLSRASIAGGRGMIIVFPRMMGVMIASHFFHPRRIVDVLLTSYCYFFIFGMIRNRVRK